MASIYEQLGGEAAINAAVDIFYRKVLTDPKLAPFFESTEAALRKDAGEAQWRSSSTDARSGGRGPGPRAIWPGKNRLGYRLRYVMTRGSCPSPRRVRASRTV